VPELEADLGELNRGESSPLRLLGDEATAKGERGESMLEADGYEGENDTLGKEKRLMFSISSLPEL
jgi:hypothetical protein